MSENNQNNAEATEEDLPQQIHILPLQGKPIFPGIFTPIMISEDHDIAAIDKAMADNKVIGLILTKDPKDNPPTKDDLHDVGTAAKIFKRINLPDGGINIFISTLKRFRILEIHNESSPYVATVEYIDDIINPKNKELQGLTRALLMEIKQISEDNPLFTEEMRVNMVNLEEPAKTSDFIVSILNISRSKQQEILEIADVKERMEKVLVYIKKEHELVKIQKRIAGEINEKIEKNQREYFLREELKAIKTELGEPTSGRDSEYIKIKETIKKFNFQGEVEEQVEKELEKFQIMEPSSSEYMVTRNYLDWITCLPWDIAKTEEVDIAKVEDILNKDHYGLEDVKERIMEYMAVRKIKKDSKGSIILLTGPPGVGKTSIGKSIARSMNRPFFRFSVGGMRDEAEIKGHRRTYVGAMPGKIIQGLKIAKSKSPVFMIDEIDKLGISFQGDPSSALLEVLDPEQNIHFRDHYLDLPFDLSHVIFVATANTLDPIPRPLLDRMEIIRLSGYIVEDKIEIAKRYIIPKSLKKHGLKRSQIRYNKLALKTIAEGYARDAGMRTYEKAIDRIHRKVARKVVGKTEDLPLRISADQLEDYLKKPHFREDGLKIADKPGMALGLAWTSMGGDVLVIEAEAVKTKAGFKLTGQMGDVMKESASIAYTRARKIIEQWGNEAEEDFFEKNMIHLHIPEGATPKDGPSAGITMTSALLSLATSTIIKSNLAVTGELSLTGKVLAVGGLKEKTIAARRHNVKHIVIPEANIRDIEEISDQVKKGITFHPVTKIEEVISLVMPGLKYSS